MDVIDKQLGIANEQSLIELSNKGIYKRALKESKNMTLSAEKIHECYIVKLDGETCTIKSPLDESQCTCVSRGMCRHIITAILLLKAQLSQYDGEDITPEVITSEPEQAEIELPEQPEIKFAFSGYPEKDKRMRRTVHKNNVWNIYQRPCKNRRERPR